MVLCQIAITTAATTNYFVGVSGKCRVKILDLKYMCSGAGVHEIVAMSSSVLNFPNSNKNALLFSSQGDHHQFASPEALDIPADLAGYIDLTITTFANGAVSNFQGAVLTLDITPIIEMPTVKMTY